MEFVEIAGPDVLKARNGRGAIEQSPEMTVVPTGAPPGPTNNLGRLLRSFNYEDDALPSQKDPAPGGRCLAPSRKV